MASLGIYLAYDSAKDAMKYYEDVFNAKIIHRFPITKEMNEIFNLEEDSLEDSTYSGLFEVDGVAISCSDRVDNNGDFNDSFNIMIQYSKDEIDDFQSMRKLLIDNNKGVIIYDSQVEELSDHLMLRFKDIFGIIWSFIVI